MKIGIKRFLLLSAAAVVAANIGAEAPQTSIYQSNGGFSRLEGPVSISHIEAGSVNIAAIEASSGRFMLETGTIDSIRVQAVGVPRVRITIPDYPDLQQVQEKELYLDALISIEGNGLIDDLAEGAVTVKGRGNSTWLFPKKPMRLKFNKKTAIGDFAKAKSYVLLANFIDPTHMRNTLALWLARELGMAWANHSMPCDVTFNGNDLGTFLLTEKIGINAGSVDIDETKGILLELSNDYDEKYKFYSATYGLPVMVKDPDFDEIAADNPSWGSPQSKLAQWKADFERAERLASQGRGFEAFDLESFVDYMLLYNVVLNGEIGWPKSLYIYKEKFGDDVKWMFGPAWDFDASFNLEESIGNSFQTRPYAKEVWLNPLFIALKNTPGFIDLYVERFKYFHSEIYPRMMDFFDEYAAYIEPSAKANGQIWNYDYDTGWCLALNSFEHRNHVANLREWFGKRVAHLAFLANQNRYD